MEHTTDQTLTHYTITDQANPDQETTNQATYDVLIVGSGMVGASLACALSDRTSDLPSLKIGILDSNPKFLEGEFTADGRASAIALGSAYVWQNIGVWEIMARHGVTPMHKIQVSEGDTGYGVQLRREEMGAEALGFIVENVVTQRSLWEFLQTAQNVDFLCPAQLEAIEETAADHLRVQIQQQGQTRILKTKLLIGADGGRSQVRNLAAIPIETFPYPQTCIVVTVKLEHSHQNIAHERFQPSGPFAVLPLDRDRCCIVWTATTAETPHLLALNEADFLAELRTRFGTPLLEQVGKIHVESRTRAHYVPRKMLSKTYVRSRLALIGDAAHTTHPVAGQGVNLGIRDVAALAHTIRTAHQQGEDIGSLSVLKRYEQQRIWDNLGVITVTDLTNRIFSNQNILYQWIRRFGLILLSLLLPARKLLMTLMMGLHIVKPSHQGQSLFPLIATTGQTTHATSSASLSASCK